MTKKFSRSWTASIDTAKQRKYRYNAPLHVRQKMISAHLDKKLRKETGRRSIPLRRDDEVKVMAGGFKGKTGKVTRVDLKKLRVFVDNVKQKKVSGQEVEISIDPSNLLVTKINLDDKKRRKFVERKKDIKK
ncbi:MAG: 50S ribosomal protein L24 [Candidatus Aenigmarchaeota archaeon]|nr:50S ribosomal protein L24 [Candidatus Aenigmarchaeota archaeon]